MSGGRPGRPALRDDPSAGCPVLHVDMDAFFASVATRDRPDLEGVPVVVGGGERGVVLCADYLARAHGVRSAMPVVRARRLCPSLVVVRVDHDVVAAVSAAVVELFRSATPLVEVLSPDEAFLDVRGATHRLGSPRDIAELLRAVVHDEQRIACSVGVAATPAVAKIASRRAKPDGVVVVPPEEVAAFLHPLDVGELWGVGPSTRTQLRRLGLVTVADLARTPVEVLQHALGPGRGRQLHELAHGRDRRAVRAHDSPHRPGGGMGADETFGRDTDDVAFVHRELLRLASRLTGRMRRAGVAGRTVTLKVRLADFTTLTRSATLPDPTDVTVEVHRTAVRLFDALRPRTRVRLVGVRVEGLVPRARVQRQLVLGERELGWAEADRAVDRATRRFGCAAVRPATLLGPQGRPGPPGRGTPGAAR